MKNGCYLGAAVLACALALPGSAATITEVGDAGQLLLTAQSANSMPGGTALTNIYGAIGTGDADLYKIYLTGGQTFSATTTLSFSANAFDTQLFLFDSAGIGVYANDDSEDSPPQSTLPASISLTPSASGIYYLAISGSGYLPLSSGGFIFPVTGGLLDQSGGIQNAVGPTGPGGALALNGWSSTSSEVGDYDIALTGAQFLPSQEAAVPEPSAVALTGLGLAVLGLALRRRSA